jgi:hypothetical protein
MKPIGEVIAASTTSFTAVCREVFEPPSFGSFVTAGAGATTAYGVVASVQTGSLDSQRRPVAFGMQWEQLAREQPQLVELLQTTFEVATVGFGDEAGIHHYLPPRPPRVHESVLAASPTEVAAVTDSLEFLRTLAGLEAAPVHELVAAAVREASLARGRDEAFLGEAARAVAEMFKDDYDRAMSIVRRLA